MSGKEGSKDKFGYLINHIYLLHRLPQEAEEDELAKDSHITHTIRGCFQKFIADFEKEASTAVGTVNEARYAALQKDLAATHQMLVRHERLESEKFSSVAIIRELQQMENGGKMALGEFSEVESC